MQLTLKPRLRSSFLFRMTELNHNQIETLRHGLESAFVSFKRLERFVHQKFDKGLYSYTGREDAFPNCDHPGRLPEGWIEDLVEKLTNYDPKSGTSLP
jgi:hypothetical protein